MRVSVLLCVALFLSACGDESAPKQARTGSTAGFDWAILPPETGSEFNANWGPFFSPAPEDVKAAMDGIRAHLDAQMKVELDPKVGSTKAWREIITRVKGLFGKYRCQVLGVVGEDERRFLYLNFVHEEQFTPRPIGNDARYPPWTRVPEIVDGGGHHYWNVRFYPKRRVYEQIEVHGES